MLEYLNIMELVKIFIYKEPVINYPDWWLTHWCQHEMF